MKCKPILFQKILFCVSRGLTVDALVCADCTETDICDCIEWLAEAGHLDATRVFRANQTRWQISGITAKGLDYLHRLQPSAG